MNQSRENAVVPVPAGQSDTRTIEKRPPRGWYLGAAIVAVCVTLASALWIYLEYAGPARASTLALGLAVLMASLAMAVLLGFRATFTFRTETGPRPYVPPSPASAPSAYSSLDLKEDRSRRSLFALLGTGFGALAAVALLPVRSLGTRPRLVAGRGVWRAGVRLVTPTGQLIRPADIPPGSLTRGVPQVAPDDYPSAVLVLRLPTPKTQTDDNGLAQLRAFSQLCTHAGCAVSIYRKDINRLVCPCHWSSFDANDGSVIAGPASHSLPQLPLAVDGEGYLIAADSFRTPPGPALGCRASLSSRRRV